MFGDGDGVEDDDSEVGVEEGAGEGWKEDICSCPHPKDREAGVVVIEALERRLNKGKGRCCCDFVLAIMSP